MSFGDISFGVVSTRELTPRPSFPFPPPPPPPLSPPFPLPFPSLPPPSPLPAASTSTSTTTGYSRREKSLGLLGERFVRLYAGAGRKTISLDDAATSLGVERRRIYDIVNILESLDIVEVSWVGMGWVGLGWDGVGWVGTVVIAV